MTEEPPRTTQIVNARLVNEGGVLDGDLLLRGQKIVGINRPTPANAMIFDAGGAWLLPGMIDTQVNFGGVGFEYRGSTATESRAAIAGGITSYLEQPTGRPPTDSTATLAALTSKHRRASISSAANYGFHLGVSRHNQQAIRTVDRRLICGVQALLQHHGAERAAEQEQLLAAIFGSTDLLTTAVAQDEADDRMVNLARRFGARLHVLRVSTAQTLGLFAPEPARDKGITAGVCLPQLFFNQRWPWGTPINCHSTTQEFTNQQALLQGVNDDRIDVIATGHVPTTANETARPDPDKAPALPLVQHALLALFEQVRAGLLTVPAVVRKVAHTPADLFEIEDRGYLRAGYFADLALIDDRVPAAREFSKSAGKPKVFDRDPLPAVLSGGGWSPFAGLDLRARVRATWVNGYLRYANGQFLPGPCGQALRYRR